MRVLESQSGVKRVSARGVEYWINNRHLGGEPLLEVYVIDVRPSVRERVDQFDLPHRIFRLVEASDAVGEGAGRVDDHVTPRRHRLTGLDVAHEHAFEHTAVIFADGSTIGLEDPPPHSDILAAQVTAKRFDEGGFDDYIYGPGKKPDGAL